MKKIFLMLVLCMGICFAACGQKENGSENSKAKKSFDFVVTINGVKYDLTGDFMTLLNQFLDNEIVVVKNGYPYNKDGSVDTENMYTELDCVSASSYRSGIHVKESYNFSLKEFDVAFEEPMRQLVADENTDDITDCFVTEDGIVGIYVNGKFLDRSTYLDKVKTYKAENKTLFDVNYEYGLNPWVYSKIDTQLSEYNRENFDQHTSLKKNITNMSDISLSRVEEMVSDFDNLFAITIAAQDMYNQLMEGEIDSFAVITVSKSFSRVSFTYHSIYEEEAETDTESLQ